jgi:hypothetical protein
MIAIKTDIKFDTEKPQVQYDMVVSIAKIWNRLKFAYQIVSGNGMRVESIYNFRNTNDIRDAISVLRKHIPKETKVFSMQKAFPEAILPTKAHESDVGWDLATPIDFRLNPGETRRIDFGIIVDIQEGYYIQVYSRSSVAWKYSTMVALGVGVVDCFSDKMLIKTLDGDKNINDVKIHDICLSVDDDLSIEKDEITAIYYKGFGDIFRFETEDGFLEVTGNTVVYTNNGPKKASDVDIEDFLIYLE